MLTLGEIEGGAYENSALSLQLDYKYKTVCLFSCICVLHGYADGCLNEDTWGGSTLANVAHGGLRLMAGFTPNCPSTLFSETESLSQTQSSQT